MFSPQQTLKRQPYTPPRIRRSKGDSDDNFSPSYSGSSESVSDTITVDSGKSAHKTATTKRQNKFGPLAQKAIVNSKRSLDKSPSIYFEPLSQEKSLRPNSNLPLYKGSEGPRSPFASPPAPNNTQSPKMPAYRSGGRRQTRAGLVDHDIHEGLPVKHWRREYVTVTPQAPQENNGAQSDIWAPYLPWGVPKDTHLLSPLSQNLLRAIRSGVTYPRRNPLEDDDEEDAESLGDMAENREDELKESGFTARAWKQIPRYHQGPEIEYLAKRRKGLPSNTPKPAPPPTVVKTTIRKTDAAGNEYLQDIVVPHGQVVEGDIVSQTTIPDPNAAEATPFRRRGPVGRKGRRGPGRGRKKMLPVTPHITSDPTTQASSTAAFNVHPQGIKMEDGIKKEDGTKMEDGNDTTPVKNGDVDMVEDRNPVSDVDDGDQGDDDDDLVHVQDSPSRPRRNYSQQSPPLGLQNILQLNTSDITMGGTGLPGPIKSELEKLKDEGKSGSPLKQIALTTSTVSSPLASPSTTRGPMFHPLVGQAAFIPEVVMEPINERNAINYSMQAIVGTTAPTELPSPPPHPTEAHEQVAVEVLTEEEEEEVMLLEFVEYADNAQVDAAVPVVPGETNISPIIPEAFAPPSHTSTFSPAHGIDARYEPAIQPDPLPSLIEIHTPNELAVQSLQLPAASETAAGHEPVIQTPPPQPQSPLPTETVAPQDSALHSLTPPQATEIVAHQEPTIEPLPPSPVTGVVTRQEPTIETLSTPLVTGSATPAEAAIQSPSVPPPTENSPPRDITAQYPLPPLSTENAISPESVIQPPVLSLSGTAIPPENSIQSPPLPPVTDIFPPETSIQSLSLPPPIDTVISKETASQSPILQASLQVSPHASPQESLVPTTNEDASVQQAIVSPTVSPMKEQEQRQEKESEQEQEQFLQIDILVQQANATPDASLDKEPEQKPIQTAAPPSGTTPTSVQPMEEDDDDDFPDLLGGLERNLYGDSRPPVPSPALPPPAAMMADVAEVMAPAEIEIGSTVVLELKDEEKMDEKDEEKFEEKMVEEKPVEQEKVSADVDADVDMTGMSRF